MKKELSWGFFGSGMFAARCLDLLSRWRRPSWIVTAPPMPAGRGNALTPTPVDFFAGSSLRDIPLIRTSHASSEVDVLRLGEDFPVDFSFVIDFGQLIREPVLAWNEPVGCLNIHPSALPLYRGAAPVQRALIDGRSETGVTVFKLAAGMDSGPILLCEKIGIKDDDAGRLLDRAAVVGTSAFIKYASEHPIEEWTFEPQDDSLATIAPKIRPDEERIDWGDAAVRICGLVRALAPKPGAWTTVRGRRLKVLDASSLDSSHDSGVANGALFGVCEDGVLVSAGDNSVLLRAVQMEGKKIQSALEWWNGLRAKKEEQLL